MGFSLANFFHSNRRKIIDEWVDRLHKEVGDQYAARPRAELVETVTTAYDADVKAIIEDDYTAINQFINKITGMRLEAGFLMSDVQKAFELFRIIIVPLLVEQTTLEEFSAAIVRLNQCLNYTIHRFSDYFQKMHEKEIIAHNRMLEEQVRARTAELQASEIKYKTLVEEINDGYFVVQGDTIVFANNAFCRMHGYSQDEVIGKDFFVFVAPESRKAVIGTDRLSSGAGLDGGSGLPDAGGILNRVSELSNVENAGPGESTSSAGTAGTLQYLRLNKDQSRSPTEILSKKARYANRLSKIGICRDITSRVEMEKKIRETERMAYIGQITTSLSHEIRNPLSAVKMNLQILKKNARIKGNDQRRIDISVREVNRLEKILQELLDFAKPLQLNPGTHETNRILTDSVELLEMKFKEKAIAIVADLDPGLPKMKVDRQKLEQALINILLNAMESSPRESSIQIATSFDERNGDCVVTIADEGHGIPQGHLADIFKPFFTTKSQGTGLGLSNAYRIIEAHGGRIVVDNRQPAGAFCKISIPTGGAHG